MSIQYAGGTNIHNKFSGNTKNDLLTNILAGCLSAGWSLVQGVTPSVVTMTIASPGVVTLVAHGLPDGTRIVFNTTGALPTGLSANTVYFVKSPATDTFNVAATSGGTAINTSGSQSGVHTMSSEILIQTATTSQGYNLNCRFRDNAGTGIQFSIESTDGVKKGTNSTTTGQTLIPSTGKFWRLVANRYQFFCWADGDYIIGNEFICVTCPYVFSFLTPTYIGLLVGGGRGAATPCFSCAGNWRYNIYNTVGDTAQNYYQALYHTSLVDFSSSTSASAFRGTPELFPQVYGNTTATTNNLIYRYGNGDALTIDAVISWGLTSITDEPQIRCQLWDSIIVTDQFLGDVTTSFDSHNWIALTSSTISSTKSTLFIVTP